MASEGASCVDSGSVDGIRTAVPRFLTPSISLHIRSPLSARSLPTLVSASHSFPPACKLTLAFTSAFYSMYEFSKRKFSSIYTPPPGQQLPVWCLLTSGASGGVAYWLASYPLGERFLALVLITMYLASD